ncbi:MAG: hypothetical protein KDA24_28440 [Deltaproteobacteria bacterium]|nr:hypothetical protein [Deltaproteobacteria bacterium]
MGCRPMLLAVVAVALVGCPIIEPDAVGGLYDMPGGRIDGNDVLTSWTAQPFPWQVRLPNPGSRLVAQPGGQWQLPYRARVDLSAWTEDFSEFEEVIIAVLGEWRHDEEGHYRQGAQAFAMSANLTTTGIPIERFDGWPRLQALHGKEGSPFEGIAVHPVSPTTTAAEHVLDGTITVNLPSDTPEGWYEPRMHVLVRVKGVADPVHLAEYSFEWNDWAPGVMPLVKVGSPAPIKLPWSILTEYAVAGRAGGLPTELEGRMGLIGRSGFPTKLILRPGTYDLTPSMPTLFPRDHLARVDGGDDVQTERFDHYYVVEQGRVQARVKGPGEPAARDLGARGFARMYGGPDDEDMGPAPRPRLQGGPYSLDLTKTGAYEVVLSGSIGEMFGRPVSGGGTYEVFSAHPLTFSTSVKPGTSFLVGDGYPAKVNVNPPFPATVEVIVDWYPNSDPERKQRWQAEGPANMLGHFVPYDTPPLRFEEPGEYVSYVTTSYVDARGELWLGTQTSAGVVAPAEQGAISLHGTRSFPWIDYSFEGAEERFNDRRQVKNSFLPQTNLLLQDPFVPFRPEDTLFMPVNFSEENTIQPKFSWAANDEQMAKDYTAAYSKRSALPIPWSQPPGSRINYLSDVTDLSTEGFAYFPTSSGVTDELPVASVGGNGWNPFGFPQKRAVTAYAYVGVVRPGFPVMTSVFDYSAKGFYWTASPNTFGGHWNRGLNGDMDGDVYRITGGMVLKDHITGENHYDAYASTVVFKEFADQPGSASILEPGARPLRSANGRDHELFIATDTHDVLEVGELMGLGGVVMPIVPAKVAWTVTKPSGAQLMVYGTANRLGVVRGSPAPLVDEPGIWKVEPVIEYQGMKSDLPGLVDGSFWHVAVDSSSPTFLESNVPARTRVASAEGFDMELTWPEDIENPRLSFGVIMPGQVLDQGVLELDTNTWTYDFDPIQWAAQTTNFDARELASGRWTLAETMVFQFFVEGTRNGEPVYDGLRLFLRRDMLYNMRALMAAPPKRPVRPLPGREVAPDDEPGDAAPEAPE